MQKKKQLKRRNTKNSLNCLRMVKKMRRFTLILNDKNKIIKRLNHLLILKKIRESQVKIRRRATMQRLSLDYSTRVKKRRRRIRKHRKR